MPAPTRVVIIPDSTPGTDGGGTGVVAPLPGDTGSLDVIVTGTHTVGAGETLSGIATQYGVSLEALRAANNRYNDLIFVGEVLNIPAEEGK